MTNKQDSIFKVASGSLNDDALENVSGGSYGATAHTKFLNSKNYNMWICTSPDQIALYGAGWAGHCVQLNESLEILAADNLNYDVAIVDVDENPDFWKNYISYIPTIIKFHDGFEVTRIVGYKPLEELRKLF